MRRFLCMVLTGIAMIGCLCTNAGAVDAPNAVLGEYELAEAAITRATGSFNTTVKANSEVMVDTKFTLAAGETVRIRASYSPEDASMDFGLLDSDGVYHYVNVTTGSIDQDDQGPGKRRLLAGDFKQFEQFGRGDWDREILKNRK